MNYSIRSFKNEDFKEIASWWKASTGGTPLNGMMIENGTFILEIENVPALSLTVLLTQSKDLAYISSYVKNPIFDFSLDKYGAEFWKHCQHWAKERGYSRVICFSDNEKLTKKYESYGMKKNYTGLTSFLMEF